VKLKLDEKLPESSLPGARVLPRGSVPCTSEPPDAPTHSPRPRLRIQGSTVLIPLPGFPCPPVRVVFLPSVGPCFGPGSRARSRNRPEGRSARPPNVAGGPPALPRGSVGAGRSEDGRSPRTGSSDHRGGQPVRPARAPVGTRGARVLPKGAVQGPPAPPVTYGAAGLGWPSASTCLRRVSISCRRSRVSFWKPRTSSRKARRSSTGRRAARSLPSAAAAAVRSGLS
jgi:hypothetical protein